MEEISEKIRELLANHPMESKQMVEKLTFTEADVLAVLRLMLDSGKIRLNAVNQYFIK